MLVTARVSIVAASVISTLLLGAGPVLGETAPPAAEPAPSARIVGEWTSGPFESPLGRATQVFCFRADGTVALHSQTQGRPSEAKGTYLVEAGRLTITWSEPASTSALQLTWSGDNLVLADDSGMSRTYRRSSSECAAP
jgi:uncharacterized protein (TIGR03066 family)